MPELHGLAEEQLDTIIHAARRSMYERHPWLHVFPFAALVLGFLVALAVGVLIERAFGDLQPFARSLWMGLSAAAVVLSTLHARKRLEARHLPPEVLKILRERPQNHKVAPTGP